MAEPAAESTSSIKHLKRRIKASGFKAPASDPNSYLPWTDSLPEEDPFALLSSGTEGGFLSLEEIDEAEYGFSGGEGGVSESKTKSKKRKGRKDGVDSAEEGSCVIDSDRQGEKKGKKKKTAKKKMNKKNREKQVAEGEVKGMDNAGDAKDDPSKNNAEDVDKDNDSTPEDGDFYAWNELRLHPLLMKSIHRLGFREPTPIQKACIPAAAHQGKDVIGAAETGSGKTLAFGLPILQRLLDEQEKDSGLLKERKSEEEADQGRPLRALIVTPTRELALQVTDHLKEAAKLTNITVVPIVGGMSTEKQERLLKRRPEIIVGTPGRLWELMSGGDQHLGELHSLSFFVLDEADRMIENGHFRELQSIIDMLPTPDCSTGSQVSAICSTVPNIQRKKRQTCVFSATIALSDSFRKKLKRGSQGKTGTTDGLSSIEKLSERAGMRANAAIVDLTKASIVAENLEESFIECTEENKEAYLYYILSVHGHGRTIVFCTSIAALRRIASLLRIVGINAWPFHSEMQQRARLKAIDRFRESEQAVLVATDVAARGIDIPNVRTVVHFQLPHSADVYIHRSGRTARASSDGCCIALISPSDRAKFYSLCKSMSKENLIRFPLDESYMLEISKRVSLARQIDKILRNNSQEKAKKNWLERNAESAGLVVEDCDSEEETVRNQKIKKMSSHQMQNLQQELKMHLKRPLQPKHFSSKFLAGAGVSPLVQQQLEELSKQRRGGSTSTNGKLSKLIVIGQDCVEPLQALRNSGHEVCLNLDKRKEMKKLSENLKRKRKEEKKHERDGRRKKRKNAKAGM